MEFHSKKAESYALFHLELGNSIGEKKLHKPHRHPAWCEPSKQCGRLPFFGRAPGKIRRAWAVLWASHCKRKPETNASRVCARGFGMFGARPAWVWQGFSMFLAKVWQVGVCRVFLPMVWQAMVFFLAAIGQGSRGFWRAWYSNSARFPLFVETLLRRSETARNMPGLGW